MKKFFSIGLLLLGVTVSQAQLTWFNTGAIVSGSSISATNTLVTTGNGIVRSLQFIGGNAGATVSLYDNGTATNKVNVSADYITVSQTAGTVLTTNVTYTGVTNIITNSVISMSYTTNTGSATTFVTLPVLLSVYVPASTLVTVTDPNIKFQAGLVTSVSPTNLLTTGITIIGSYAPLR